MSTGPTFKVVGLQAYRDKIGCHHVVDFDSNGGHVSDDTLNQWLNDAERDNFPTVYIHCAGLRDMAQVMLAFRDWQRDGWCGKVIMAATFRDGVS